MLNSDMVWGTLPLAFLILASTGGFVALALTSLKERERTAFRRSLALGLLCFLSGLAFLSGAPVGWHVPVALGVGVVGLLGIAALFWPWPRPDRSLVLSRPLLRKDERNTLFSRNETGRNPERSEAYYREFPEHKDPDEGFRRLPGLTARDAACADPWAFAGADALFALCGVLGQVVGGASDVGEAAHELGTVSPEALTRKLLGWVRHMGAHSAGVTRLDPLHVYHTLGRGDRYGQSPALDHPWALAFTVEMDYGLVRTGPGAPTVMESARRYLDAAVIAVATAQLLTRLGYRARAHIDANYLLIAPLVARDAGLGEIGRMGLLMTPDLGPRVRIGVVTTDAPLRATPRLPDPAVTDFCLHCEKCVRICPSRAIPAGPPEAKGGEVRWQINQEKCFTYWCQVGTDCGRCMALCPFSHPRGGLHDLVRWMIRRSPLFRRLALLGDDLIYGRKPAPLPPPFWATASKEETDPAL